MRSSLTLIALAACGRTPATPTNDVDASLTPDSAIAIDAPIAYPAPHPNAPSATKAAGTVMASPTFVSIFFSGDPLATQIQAFESSIVTSEYWTSASEEYGVTGGSFSTMTLVSPGPATISDAAIQTFLAAQMPAPDSHTVYVVHYPQQTVVLRNGTGCADFAGYHSEVLVGAVHVPYVVMPRCASFASLSGFDLATAVESGLLVDTATDPRPETSPAFGRIDVPHAFWSTANELTDLCSIYDFETIATPSYVVQRRWSNSSAAANKDPCAPSVGNVYFNAAPVLTDKILISTPDGAVEVDGKHAVVGDLVQVDVELFSEAPTAGPWTVEAYDASFLAGGPRALGLTLDRSSGQNGDTIHLRIEPILAEAARFYLVSTMGTEHHVWVGLVGN